MNFFDTSKRHLQETGWGYTKHLGHSIKQSVRLITIAAKSLIHGIIPAFFPSSGPVGVYKIYQEIRRYHHVQKILNDIDRYDSHD